MKTLAVQLKNDGPTIYSQKHLYFSFLFLGEGGWGGGGRG